MKYSILSMVFLVCCSFGVVAQSNTEIIQQFLNESYAAQGLTKADVSNWIITDYHQSKTSGATHVYIRQTLQGIEVNNGTANFAIKNGKVLAMGNRLIPKLAQKASYSIPAITPIEAVKKAAEQLGLASPTNLRVLEPLSDKHFKLNKGGISLENIPVKLMYHATEDGQVQLVWDLSIYTLDAKDWWSVQINAQDGKIINENNWVVKCSFGENGICKHNGHTHFGKPTFPNYKPTTSLQPDQYTVFPLPIESPSHGSRSLVTNPADSAASPFGWHDTDGIAGAEHTITRGNNVFAYDDVADANTPGFSPNGTALLEFNFPYNGNSAPSTYQSAAITNLFYMNNMMHDIWYYYGFDEAAGNFQDNNYGNSGTDDDYVLAEAQDGGGTNNANFATPPDGFNPRMQMYLWTGAGGGGDLTVNSPTGIAGIYGAVEATFGPGWPPAPLTDDLVLAVDGTAPVNDACEALTNGTQLNGKIAVIDRGNCAFVDKVQAAQNAGAVAAIVVNNTTAAPIAMGGTSATITIPAIMISLADGNTIKSQMASGTVNATINPGNNNDKDGDLDNGIIAHEYGHGISTRLTGGASNSNCLSNDEQMGEGWSDWFGLMLTIEPGDVGADIRGIGTYASGQPVNGTGIRPAAYSTDFAVNNYTYGNSNNTASISMPHGVGFIYCTALWDLNWALVNQYGGTPDPDVYNGSGGNNIAMNLVIESLKLQPCNPGMLDGRDAILAADQLLYNGAHRCLIWDVFANRGFGYSASQGSAGSRTDQSEAFDLPPICQTPTNPPAAAFTPNTFSTCQTTISFTDSSYNVPQSWYWEFGDGATDTIQNPTHTYNSTGTYVVKLVVSNPLGADSTTQIINVNLPPTPTAPNIEVCAGDTAFLIATGATGVIEWLNTGNNLVDTGDTLMVTNVGTNQTYYAQNVVGPPSQQVPPANNTFGGGGYHASGYHGALNFTAQKAFTIKSAWVDAQGAGPRTIILASGSNTNGQTPATIVDQVTVNIPAAGPQRVALDLEVPAAGNYNLGGSNVDLFRNNGGASYPYTLAGYMDITSSSATTSPTGYYYYFYDIEVQDPQCVSAIDTATITPIASNFTYSQNNNTVTFTDQSSGATAWFWDFGDGNTSTLQNPIHNYATSGSHTVTLTINNGICTTIQNLTVITGVHNIGNDKPMITLVPNPTRYQATVNLSKAANSDLEVAVTDLQGKRLQQYVIRQGQTTLDLDITDLPAAVYLVRIKGEQYSEIRKLIVRE